MIGPEQLQMAARNHGIPWNVGGDANNAVQRVRVNVI